MTEQSRSGSDLVRDERLQIMLAPEELEVIDDFRFKWRMPSRAATVRELLKRGLAAEGVMGAHDKSSSGFGVIDPSREP
jgi:hypothetical protein